MHGKPKLDAIGEVAMVVIDPVSAYLGGTDSHKNADDLWRLTRGFATFRDYYRQAMARVH